MIVENDWIKTNIRDRLVNKNVNLVCQVTPYNFKESGFAVACNRAAKAIGKKYPKIYLALSGGLDSMHVFKIFVKNKIEFTPVIVRIKENRANRQEIARALHLVREHEIKPKIIEMTEAECFHNYFNTVCKPAGGIGIYSAPLLAVAELANQDGAIVVTGEHLINVWPDPDSDLISSEYDFYVDYIDEGILLPFFLYSVDIINATIKFALDNGITSVHLKSALYKSKDFTIDNEYSSYLAFATALSRKYLKRGNYHRYGKFQEFYDYLTPWRLN